MYLTKAAKKTRSLKVKELIEILAKEDPEASIALTNVDGYNCDVTLFAGDVTLFAGEVSLTQSYMDTDCVGQFVLWD